ncbi:MAG: hypothetical protein WCY36_04565 [Candidatus Omnitrophota bacterium]
MRKCILSFLILIICIFVDTASGDNNNVVKLQEPKGNTETLIDFAPTLIKFPFEIKYPAAWYVREEVAGNVQCLFFTREPIKKEGDRYSVGVSLLYNIGYFASKEPSESVLSQTAHTVIKIRDWEESKKQFIESLNDGGNIIVSQADTTVSGQPALKVEYESKNTRMTIVYIKAGIHLLSITFEIPLKEYEQYKDIFEKMLTSFFFTR